MTGFGRASGLLGGRELTAEVRSVNAKYLDLSFRLPTRWEHLEVILAKAVRERVARGKAVVTVNWGSGSSPAGSFSRPRYRACARELRMIRPGPITHDDVLRAAAGDAFGGDPAPEGLEKACISLVRRAVDGLVKVREHEGRQICAEIQALLDTVAACMGDIETRAPEIAHETQKRLEAALERLGQAGVEIIADRERISREVALLLVRADAREEVVRMRAHVAASRERIAGPGPHGKMLEFLIQEMQRELNTLGAKTTNLEVTQLTLRARAAVDQMREQVANVE